MQPDLHVPLAELCLLISVRNGSPPLHDPKTVIPTQTLIWVHPELDKWLFFLCLVEELKLFFFFFPSSSSPSIILGAAALHKDSEKNVGHEFIIWHREREKSPSLIKSLAVEECKWFKSLLSTLSHLHFLQLCLHPQPFCLLCLQIRKTRLVFDSCVYGIPSLKCKTG